MKTSSPKTSSTPDQMLAAALAADPDAGAAIEALQRASDRFDAIRSKLHDESVEENAKQREADARQALVRAQALSEIGQSTAQDVDAARTELTAARDALESFAGRKLVLTEELLKAQAEVAEGSQALRERIATWREAVREAAVAAAQDATRLIITAAMAMEQAGFHWAGVPDYQVGIGNWLRSMEISLPRDLTAPPVAPAATTAFQLENRSRRQVDERIEMPKPEKAADAYRPSGGGWKAPGAPYGIDSLALGDPNPGRG